MMNIANRIVARPPAIRFSCTLCLLTNTSQCRINESIHCLRKINSATTSSLNMVKIVKSLLAIAGLCASIGIHILDP